MMTVWLNRNSGGNPLISIRLETAPAYSIDADPNDYFPAPCAPKEPTVFSKQSGVWLHLTLDA